LARSSFLVRHQQEVGSCEVCAQKMDQVNPLYVLRNYLAQQAISRAKEGDASEIDVLLKLLRTLCVEQAGYEKYAAVPPD
jgi:serine/tyrosine/threonine adenylyltransferase